jgi:hypothetical protein
MRWLPEVPLIQSGSVYTEPPSLRSVNARPPEGVRYAALARVWQTIARLFPTVRNPRPKSRPQRDGEEVLGQSHPARRAQKGATESPSNKIVEVIAMMKGAKGATLAEITEATGWQKHTVRGFVNILGGRGGEKIESSNANGERRYRIAIPRAGLNGTVPVKPASAPHHALRASRPLPQALEDPRQGVTRLQHLREHPVVDLGPLIP